MASRTRVAWTQADKVLSPEAKNEIVKINGYITDLVSSPPNGMRDQILVLLSIWDRVYYTTHRRDGGRKRTVNPLPAYARHEGHIFATENNVALREADLESKIANSARLLVINPNNAADAADAFIDYWANQRLRPEEQVQVRTAYINARDELFKGMKKKPHCYLLRGDVGLPPMPTVLVRSRASA